MILFIGVFFVVIPDALDAGEAPGEAEAHEDDDSGEKGEGVVGKLEEFDEGQVGGEINERVEKEAKEDIGGDELREFGVGVGGPYEGSVQHVPAHIFFGGCMIIVYTSKKCRELSYDCFYCYCCILRR